MIVASVKVDKEAISEILGTEYGEEDVKKLVWSEIDKINDDAPPYRKVKKLIIRKTDFVKNTSQKLIRFAEENKRED